MSWTRRPAALIVIVAAWLTAAPVRHAVASVETAEAFARSMLAQMGAEVGECPDSVPGDERDRVALCVRLVMDFKSFRKSWDRFATAKRGKPWRAIDVGEWETTGATCSRSYEISGTPLTIFREKNGASLLIVISRSFEPCGVDWRGNQYPKAGEGGTTKPELIRRAQPGLPRRASEERQSGKVRVEAVIRKDGTVGASCIKSVSPPGYGFENLAIAALNQWLYKPATKDGQPVDVRFEIWIEWSFP